MTVQELHDMLQEMIQLGRGDYEVQVWHNTERFDIQGVLYDSSTKTLYLDNND